MSQCEFCGKITENVIQVKCSGCARPFTVCYDCSMDLCPECASGEVSEYVFDDEEGVNQGTTDSNP